MLRQHQDPLPGGPFRGYSASSGFRLVNDPGLTGERRDLLAEHQQLETSKGLAPDVEEPEDAAPRSQLHVGWEKLEAVVVRAHRELARERQRLAAWRRQIEIERGRSGSSHR